MESFLTWCLQVKICKSKIYFHINFLKTKMVSPYNYCLTDYCTRTGPPFLRWKSAWAIINLSFHDWLFTTTKLHNLIISTMRVPNWQAIIRSRLFLSAVLLILIFLFSFFNFFFNMSISKFCSWSLIHYIFITKKKTGKINYT